MPGYLLDSSAVLALFGSEPGAAIVEPMLRDSAIHSVQVAEIVKKLANRGVPDVEAERAISALGLQILESLTYTDAVCSRAYRHKGLSLGDRICLTTADLAGMTAVTAEHRWKEIVDADTSLTVKVVLIRPKAH